MKTPREILLARHQAAEPRLDALREAVVAGLPVQAQPTRENSRSLAAVLGELFHVPRPAWAALGAAWLIIIALNIASRDPVAPSLRAPQQMAKTSKDTLQALREQKRLFAELVGALKETETDVPHFVPRPRGELRPQVMTA